MKVHRWRVLPAILAGGLLLAACGGDADDTAAPEPEPTDEGDEGDDEDGDEPVVRADADLVIWADELRSAVLQPYAEAFGEDNGISVAIQELTFDDIRDQVQVAAPAGEGPDLIVGAHDWLGELVTNGLIAPADLSGIEDEFEEVAVQAFTYEGQTYGYPYATENVALFRNPELVPDAPATWEELEQVVLDLQDAGEVRQGIAWPTEPADPYHNYPIVTALGGYVFGIADDGSYDASDLGIDADGTIAAGEKYREMIESGVLSPDVSYDLMIDLFSSGDAAFMITGPWAQDAVSAIDFEVTPIPPVDGGTPQAFVGVQGMMVSAFSENELLAQTFAREFMTDVDAQLELFEAGGRPPALTAALDQISDDPVLVAFGEAGADGLPMPAIPEMGSVWEAWTNAYTLIYEGDLEPAEAFADAAAQIRTQIDS